MSTSVKDSKVVVSSAANAEEVETFLDPVAEVGDGIEVNGTRWSFAENAPERFDAHVNKSVPLYAQGHRLIASALQFFLRPGGRVVDVDCSTGTLQFLDPSWSVARSASPRRRRV